LLGGGAAVVRTAACVGSAVFASACLGSAPTPLAPGFKGSVGLPHSGVQTEALELPKRGQGYVRYRPYGSAYWGQPELIAAIEETSAVMDEGFGGPPLVLGDLSARYGGKIPRHNSHRSGRDVDLLWYVMTPDGVPIKNPGFINVGADGIARDRSSGSLYRLDIPRQWAVVKAMLQSKRIHVQWMFCSRWVEALLIDYARARGEDDELVWRAESVMLQPKDSLPHDDHIHMRISCTPETSLTGCAGGGPYWEWLPQSPSLELTQQDLQEIGQQDPLVVQTSDEVALGRLETGDPKPGE
jgi:penicillin-insensitive murein endopeptidase